MMLLGKRLGIRVGASECVDQLMNESVHAAPVGAYAGMVDPDVGRRQSHLFGTTKLWRRQLVVGSVRQGLGATRRAREIRRGSRRGPPGRTPAGPETALNFNCQSWGRAALMS